MAAKIIKVLRSRAVYQQLKTTARPSRDKRKAVVAPWGPFSARVLLRVKGAENYAELMEWEASFAVDCANAAIDQAESAVLDAIVASKSREMRGRRIDQ